MKKRLKFHATGCIRYGIALFILIGLWWYFRTYELFLMMVMALCILPISVFVLLHFLQAFGVEVRLPATGIGKEHEVPMVILVKNSCRIIGLSAGLVFQVRNLFTEYAATEKERLWAPPGNREVLRRNLKSHHMGRVEVTVTELSLYDWLGICSCNILKEKSAWVIVGPEASEAAGEDLTAEVENFPNENETKKRGTDISPDYEIREYIPGDDLKNIHWKLTAKTGRTMVRERLATGREKINVLLALTADAEENDRLIASLHSLGLLLLDKGYPVRLCWLGYGNALQGKYLAEEGELADAMDEILSVSGLRDPDTARSVMETDYPGEAYIVVKSGKTKGTYVSAGG